MHTEAVLVCFPADHYVSSYSVRPPEGSHWESFHEILQSGRAGRQQCGSKERNVDLPGGGALSASWGWN